MYSEKADIQFDGWTIVRELGRGASARVYEVHSGMNVAALKVFDPAIFRRDEEAAERLRRQEQLVDSDIPGLIKIYNISTATINGEIAPAILMEKCDGDSLEKIDLQRRLSESDIRKIISKVAETARGLMAKGIVHRDIKPANIIFNEVTGTVTLLDTGVIRPIEGVLDVSGYAFVGTRRYSPPEFLYRTHDESQDCWTAITYYQLGATLYELATKEQPYYALKVDAQLIEAIKTQHPDYKKLAGVSPDLRDLVRLSLRRDWRTRIVGLAWKDFENLETRASTRNPIEAAQASSLTVPLGSISVEFEDQLKSVLSQVCGDARDLLIKNGFVARIEKKETNATIFCGRTTKAEARLLVLTLNPTGEGGAILHLNSPCGNYDDESFAIDLSEIELMCGIVSKRVSATM